MKWNSGRKGKAEEGGGGGGRREKKVQGWRAKETRGWKKGWWREREGELSRGGGRVEGMEGGGVTRGKSPRAIFPHIIIREGLGVSMVTTHHPLPVPLLIHSAPRLLICRRTRVGTCARMRLPLCACVYVSSLMEVVARPPCVCVCVRARLCTHVLCHHTYGRAIRMRTNTIRRRGSGERVYEYARAYVGRRWDGGREWTGGEINVFVLRPPSCALGKDSASRKALMARRGILRGISPRYCFCVQRTYPSFTSPVPLDPSLNRSHLRFVIDRTG